MPDFPARAPLPDEFYVGYFPVPTGNRRFLRWVVPITLWLLCAASFVWAWSQHDPGPAVWENGKAKSFCGTLVAAPAHYSSRRVAPWVPASKPYRPLIASWPGLGSA